MEEREEGVLISIKPLLGAKQCSRPFPQYSGRKVFLPLFMDDLADSGTKQSWVCLQTEEGLGRCWG